jgi:hypothetical protein
MQLIRDVKASCDVAKEAGVVIINTKTTGLSWLKRIATERVVRFGLRVGFHIHMRDTGVRGALRL